MLTKDKRNPAFNDFDPMPFGKYRSEPMQDVKASYLYWLWQEGLSEYSGIDPATKPPEMREKIFLANYIWNSKDDIEKETGNLIT